MRIIEQALDKLPEGPIFSTDRRVVMPAKPDVYGNIEALMNHFMLIYEGIKVPKGEAYTAVEGANGELGFYCDLGRLRAARGASASGRRASRSSRAIRR